MSNSPSVGIIGGGIAGLTAAYRLLQSGHKVRLFEAGNELGGLARTFDLGGEPVECFYHHLFKSDTVALNLLNELGIADQLDWHTSNVGLYYDSGVHPFTTPVDLLRFSPLSIPDRIRLGLMALRLRHERDGSQFEDIAAADWIRRKMGERILDVVWEPLLRGKFGDMWDQVVMTWLWNKIHTRFASRGGCPMQREVLGYMRGSFGLWTSALVDRIRELGGEMHIGTPVTRIMSEGGQPGIEIDGNVMYFDAVVATVANHVVLRLAPGLPNAYARKLRGTQYQDALCLVLALDRPLTDYYWLNVNDPVAPFVAVVEHTNLVGADRYGGRHLVYISNYVEHDAPITREDANEVMVLYAPHLKRINPAYNESWVTDRWLFHARDAQPVFAVGAGSRMPEHRTPLPGLYVANMAQIYPQDRGQNYSIAMGERVADLVARDLARAAAPRYQV